jgi:hypothetical protein
MLSSKRILAKSEHRIDGAFLEVLDSLTVDLIDQEWAIMVTGITKTHTEDLLNERRSGGGGIEDICFSDDSDSDVIKKFLPKRLVSTHYSGHAISSFQ